MPLQRYRVPTGEWKPRSPEKVFAARGWNQLHYYGNIDNSLEVEFSKVETHLPETLRVLSEAATSGPTELPLSVHRNLCQYCAFLWLTSPFAKAKAPVDFVLQVNHDLENQKDELLTEVGFAQDIIETFRKARAQGDYAILYSDESLQLVYRVQFWRLYPMHFGHFFHWTEWSICRSPIELALSDVALVQLHMQDEGTVYYVLPVGPNLLLKAKCKLGPQRETHPPKLITEVMPQTEAQYWMDVVCLSAVTELVAVRSIPDISIIRERARANGISFPNIINPQRSIEASHTEFSSAFGLRMVSEAEYVKYIHSFLMPPPQAAS